MNKVLYIIFSLIVLLLIVTGVVWFMKGSTSSPAPATTNTASSSGFTALPTGSRGSGTTTPGAPTAGFLSAPSVKPDTHNPGSYFLGNTLTQNSSSQSAPSYVINYDSQANYFSVVLLKKPFATARFAAEAYLKNLLHMNDAALCKLSYAVTVPGYVDQAASGVDYRFSFCNDAVQLTGS